GAGGGHVEGDELLGGGEHAAAGGADGLQVGFEFGLAGFDDFLGGDAHDDLLCQGCHRKTAPVQLNVAPQQKRMQALFAGRLEMPAGTGTIGPSPPSRPPSDHAPPPAAPSLRTLPRRRTAAAGDLAVSASPTSLPRKLALAYALLIAYA